MAADKTLTVSSGKIKAGENSPAYIFVPGLAPRLWYLRDARVFSDYQWPRAMFKLSECKN